MSIDLEFVELTADVLEIFFIKCQVVILLLYYFELYDILFRVQLVVLCYIPIIHSRNFGNISNNNNNQLAGK